MNKNITTIIIGIIACIDILAFIIAYDALHTFIHLFLNDYGFRVDGTIYSVVIFSLLVLMLVLYKIISIIVVYGFFFIFSFIKENENFARIIITIINIIFVVSAFLLSVNMTYFSLEWSSYRTFLVFPQVCDTILITLLLSSVSFVIPRFISRNIR